MRRRPRRRPPRCIAPPTCTTGRPPSACSSSRCRRRPRSSTSSSRRCCAIRFSSSSPRETRSAMRCPENELNRFGQELGRALRPLGAAARPALPPGLRSGTGYPRTGGDSVSGYWLAIDTATEIASVAVGRRAGAGPVQSETGAHAQGARRHASEIVRLVDFALAGLGIRPADLSGIVLGDGPGSFTGLRIGWAAAKGLAQEAGLDLVAVPSLMAAAAGAAVKLGPVPIAACFDALRGQVYGAIYVVHPGRVQTLVAPAVLTVPELVRAAPLRPPLRVGDGAMLSCDAVRAWSGAAPVPLAALPPAASVLLSLFTREGAARVITDPVTAEPVYGRLAEAQVKWEARHGRPLPDPSRPRG